MLFSLVYFLVGRVVGRVLGTGQRPNEGREIELLVLRHQVRVLQRQVKREGCIYSDHAADLAFVPSARQGQAPWAQI